MTSLRPLILPIVCIGGLFFLTGCIQKTFDITVNPDLSGKAKVEIKMPAMGKIRMDNSGPQDNKAKAKEAAAGVIENSEGVDAWKDVSYELSPEGKAVFRGTAYFKTLKDLKIAAGTIKSNDETLIFLKQADGNLFIKMKEEGKDEPAPGASGDQMQLSDEELKVALEAFRAQWGAMKPMMEGVLKEMKESYTFRWKGTLGKNNNFKINSDGSITIVKDGEAILNAMDQLINDDEWVKKQVEAKRDIQKQGPKFDDTLNGVLFGSPGPVEALVKFDGAPAFDYQAEVTEARKQKDQISKLLSVDKSSMPATGKTEPVKGTQLIGIRMGYKEGPSKGKFGNLRPFNQNIGLTVSLLVELPDNVIKVDGGKLLTATAENGANLLPKFTNLSGFQQLSEDRKAAVIEADMKLPPAGSSKLGEISGELNLLTATTTETIETDIFSFAKDATGQKFQLKVKKFGDNPWKKGTKEIEVQLKDISYEQIKEVKIVDSSGSSINGKKSGHMATNNQVSLTFTIEGTVPAEGKLVMTRYKDTVKSKAPFTLKNVDLLARP